MVNDSCVATAVVLRDLKCTSIETLDARILLQRKVYLAQDIGVPLHYGYSWYIHGPYSTDLAAVAYQVILEGFDDLRDKTIKEPYKNMLVRINDLDNKKQAAHLDSARWYELLASVAYWYNHGYQQKDKISEKLRETKPQFNAQQAGLAIDVYFDFRQNT